MPDIDFNFGFNDPSNLDPYGFKQQQIEPEDSELLEITCGQVLKMIRQLTETVRKAHRQTMDLSSYKGKEKPGTGKFENRDWLDPQKDLPKKGSSKWRVDSVREAKKNKTGIILFIDVTNGTKKRVMSLRKGFTLDAFIEALGPNTDKWLKKSIELERGGNEGQYINVAQ